MNEGLDIAFKGLNLGLAGVFLYLLITGTLRRAGEVESLETRLAAAEARADKEAQSRERIQNAVLTDLSPALLKVSTQGENLVSAAARNADLMEKMLDAFLRRIGER